MNASVMCRYDVDNNGAAATFGVRAGDLKLRVTLTDATVVNGLSLNGLALAVEKPGSFIVDYNTMSPNRGENRNILNETLVFDQANKVSANYVMGLGNCKLKYTYAYKGKTTFEPSYGMPKSAWDFSVSHKVYDDDNDVFKAIYNRSSKALALEWSRSSKANSSSKITASINMDDEVKKPKIIAETALEF